MHLLLTDAPHEAQAHAAIVVTGGTITSLWSRPSYGEALDTLRRWYAVRRTMYAIDEVGFGGNVTEEEHSPDPATATVEEIAGWYSDGDSDYYVLITAIDQIDPLDRCLREEIPAFAQEYQGEARLAVLGAMAHLNEMKPGTNNVPGTGR